MKKEESPSFKGTAPAESRSQELRTIDRRNSGLCLALIVVVCAFYSPIVHNDFLNYDDKQYIMDTPVRAGLTWKTVAWAFTTNTEANWHPLTWLSHALDCDLFGLSPVGPHCVNVLLHAANAVLLFLLFEGGTGFRWRSLMVASLFALHPINVESVAWAAERKNVLSMLLFLLAFYAYVWYTREPGPRRYAVVAGCYALALMAKPQVITFPFLLLLFDYWPLGRISLPGKTIPRGAKSQALPTGWVLLEKVPLLLLSVASAVVTMEAQSSGLAVKTFSQYSPLLRFETAVVSYVRYLGKLLWPSNLVAMYLHPTRLYPTWQVAAALLLLLLITVVVLVRIREQRYLAVGWFWFLGSLVPMIGLVQVGDQALADRYAYISFVGLFAMIVWLIADFAYAKQISPRWLAVPAVACLLALGILTYRQVGYWHDPESFWRRTLALTEDNYVAQGALAGYLRSHGRTEEAMEHYRAALAIEPNDLVAILNLGAYDHSHGNLASAIEKYQFVAERAGSVRFRSKAYTNLGFAYRQNGDTAKAMEAFEMSLQLVPKQPALLVILGAMNEQAGDLPAAVRRYTQALALQPSDVGFLMLARALRREGHDDEARAMFQRAVKISANLTEAEKQADSLLAGDSGSVSMTMD